MNRSRSCRRRESSRCAVEAVGDPAAVGVALSQRSFCRGVLGAGVGHRSQLLVHEEHDADVGRHVKEVGGDSLVEATQPLVPAKTPQRAAVSPFPNLVYEEPQERSAPAKETFDYRSKVYHTRFIPQAKILNCIKTCIYIQKKTEPTVVTGNVLRKRVHIII